jgi:hypothetical protein
MDTFMFDFYDQTDTPLTRDWDENKVIIILRQMEV